MADWLEEHGVTLVVLAGYMRLLTPAFLERFDPIVNVHPSLLPSFPGCTRSSRRSRRESPRPASPCTSSTRASTPGRCSARSPCRSSRVETLEERIHAVEHRLLPEVVRELCAR